MKKLISFAFLAIFSLQVYAFDISGTGTVYKAVDGDTFWISGIEDDVYEQLWAYSRDRDNFRHEYRSAKIRIGNVDTPESVHKNSALNTERGMSVSEHMKDIAKGQKASFRCWTIGKYGRPICAVNLDNIGDVGLYLIRNNFSPYITRFGRHPYMHNAYAGAAQ